MPASTGLPRSAADFRGRRDVGFDQRGRGRQRAGVVVEPEALVLGGEEVARVDLERDEVADGVGVLGPVQPVNRRPAGVGRTARLIIYGGLDPGGDGGGGPDVRARGAGGRHRAAAQLAGDLLPDLGLSGNTRGVD